MAPRSWELIALSLLAGIGFGLAWDHGATALRVALGMATAAVSILKHEVEKRAAKRMPTSENRSNSVSDYASASTFTWPTAASRA
jgi:hypothetical protein